MATIDPPPSITRIVEVQDPGGEFYVVYVRIPAHLSAKFPDTPWGTPIENIGLATKDTVKFPGYVLVDVEPISDRRLGDTADLFWVFQKLDGPVWTTSSLGQESLIPPRYKRLVTTVQTKQEVDPDTEPSALTGDLASSVVQQNENTGKATKINTAETLEGDASPLIGELTDTWGVNTTEESLVDEGTGVDYGFGLKSGKVVPLGNGKSTMELEYYPSDGNDNGIIYTLTGREVDEVTGAVIRVQKSLVDAERAFDLAEAADGYAELQPIDRWHSIMIVSKVITAPEDRIWTETGNINLPNRVSEIGVIWDSDAMLDEGTAGVDSQPDIIDRTIAWSADAEAAVTGSVSGSPYQIAQAGFSGSVQITVEQTFHEGPPDDVIEAHIFYPVYATLTIYGKQSTRQARGMARGLGDIQTGSGINYRTHLDTKMSVTQLGPFEHTGLALVEQGDDPFVSVEASASGGSTPGSEPYPAVTISLDLEGSATLSLPDSSVPLEPGDSYIVSVSVSHWRYQYWVREVRTATIPIV